MRGSPRRSGDGGGASTKRASGGAVLTCAPRAAHCHLARTAGPARPRPRRPPDLRSRSPDVQAPNQPILFVVNLIVVVSVVVFAAAVVTALLRRSYQRRVEEEKVAAIGTATARILHQIKNPLQTVVLHADLLQDDRVSGEPGSRREICEAIVGESMRLVAMLDELSVYASGAQRALARKPVDLEELVGRVAAVESREAAGTGLEVDASGISPVRVAGDPYYLQQVFENLVRNAREAMENRDGSRLVLRTGRMGQHAVAQVIDNGPGIPPETLERVFQPFFSTKGKGMGLGLAVCREIVEGHGGRLEVFSRVEQGTTFTVHLPLHAGEGAPAPAPVEKPATGGGAAAWS